MKQYIALFCAFCYAISAWAQINQETFLDNLNGWREEGCRCGMEQVKPVSSVYWDNDLEDIATAYAKELASVPNYVSHVGIHGETVQDRLDNASYSAKYVVECLAALYGNEDMIIDHLINSPEYCNNLMDKKVTVVGAGREKNIWVVLLAHPNLSVGNNKDKKQD